MIVFLPVRGAIVDRMLEAFGMVARIFGGAPHRGNTKLTASTRFVVVRAIHLSPRVATTYFNALTVLFSVLKGIFNLLFGVGGTSHLYLRY